MIVSVNLMNGWALSLHYRSDHFWIGLRASDSGSTYVWSDGSPVSKLFFFKYSVYFSLVETSIVCVYDCVLEFQLQFQNWQVNEPNNTNNVEFCVSMEELFSFRGSWKVAHCEKDLGWLCQVHQGMVLFTGNYQ